MKAWAHIFRRAALAAGLVGMSALSGCATYYDSYYDDRYSYRDDRHGDYYVARSYRSTGGYGYGGYGAANSYYDTVLWPTRRYYDPWFSPFGYGYPGSSIGFSVGYYDPFWYPAPYRYRHHRHWDRHGRWAGRDRDERRDIDRGEWRPSRNVEPFRGDEGQAFGGGRSRSRDSMPGEPRFEQRVERYEPRQQPRFAAPDPREQPRFSAPEPREQPRFSAPEPREQPRFEAPSVSRGDWSRGRDQDDNREPE